MISGSSAAGRPGDQDLRLGEEQRVGAVDGGAGCDGLVMRAALDRGQTPARAHEQDCGDDGKAENAERERERGDLVPIEQQEGGEIGARPSSLRIRGRLPGQRSPGCR